MCGQLQSSFRRLFSHAHELMVTNSKAYSLLVEFAEFAVEKGHVSNAFVKQLIAENEFRRDAERVDALKKRVAAIVDEYYSSSDAAECIECLREIGTPFFHFEVVKVMISKSLDRDNKCRELCSRWLAQAVGEELPAPYDDGAASELAPHVPKMVIDRESAMLGFNVLLQRVEELYKGASVDFFRFYFFIFFYF